MIHSRSFQEENKDKELRRNFITNIYIGLACWSACSAMGGGTANVRVSLVISTGTKVKA